MIMRLLSARTLSAELGNYGREFSRYQLAKASQSCWEVVVWGGRIEMAFAPAVLFAVGLVVAASLAVLFLWQRQQAKSSVNRLARKASVDEIPQKEVKGHCSILFGTQTGTAERFSKQLKGDLLQRYGDDTAYNVIDIEEYVHEDKLAREKLVFLMLATYGDGEPTDNAANFYAWVTRSANEAAQSGEKILQGVTFAIFGLGNKQYEHFCAVGKRVYDAMTALGATPVVDRGEGDDDEDIDADFDSWKEKLLAALDTNPALCKTAAPRKGHSMEIAASDCLAAFEVQFHEDCVPSVSWNGNGTGARSPFPATVTMNRELHQTGSDRSCLHLEVNIAGCEASYEAGDHIGIVAENEDAVIARAAAALGHSLSLKFSLQSPSNNPHNLSPPFPGPITLRDALAWHADLLSPMSKQALQAFAAFVTGEESKKLRHLLSPEGQEDYKSWQSQSRCLLEVLEEYLKTTIPLGAFFGSIADRLQTRFYSISSSPKISAASVHVTCSLVEHPTSTGREHRGVVSHQLQRIKVGSKLPVYLRRSTFKLPADPTAPLVMIGPGTGLAPFRGFLQERAAIAASGRKLGPAHLFFGCRNRKQDYIYETELADLQAQGGYTQLHTAFSREGPVKVYVQHRLEAMRAQIWPLIQEGGYVYVCGEAKNMAKDVHRTLLKMAESQPEGPEAFMAALSNSGRYQKDVW